MLPKNIDILTYSFPCQDLSQQGKQRGLGKGTRSGLLFEIERILKSNIDRLPKVLVLENVKALSTRKFINDFNNWISVLDSIGYKTEWKVVNSIDFGSYQNRERVFAISTLGKSLFKFPKPIKNNKNLGDLITFDKSAPTLDNLLKYNRTPFTRSSKNITKSRLLGYTNFNSEAYLYLPVGLGPTLTASGANSRLKFYFENENKIQSINSITAYQYMGFDKEDAVKVKETNLINENKMIFTCGNSISVEVLEAIFKEIIKNDLR
ncbi:CpG cytosine-specific DNA modification methyltransferase [Mycoplasmopsis caviae]|uniref:DNA (cytosine-5-)-methyltransferase n=1 Tax=Mycoplasmopsis caviae TaxID=55603 RepID=A0A3P8K974_9BACT|nr:CpG cytosine-specific DNA modification methyltransferase [Mycoplasmopsis caviae]